MMPDTSPDDNISVHKFAAVPNILTVSRIFTIPFLIWGILLLGNAETSILGQPWFVLGLFILACITDFLDGFLARRWALVSDFGRMIDPIADKLLVAGCLISLSIANDGIWYILVPALSIIGRDILVSGAREHAALKSRAMPPTNLAKYKTACEMIALLLLISSEATQMWTAINSAITFSVIFHLGMALLWIAALLSIYTGSLYFRAALRD